MPDPSEPSRERPERPDLPRRLTPAPQGLRRRVLARVNAEPEPLGASAGHRAGRVLDGLGPRGARLALALCAVAATALSLLLFDHDAGRPVRSPLGPAPGTAAASLVRGGGRAELRLAGMPQPPVGEVYEVWLGRGDEAPQPTDALFTPTAAGTAAVEVPGSLREVTAITVTAEPRGGSSHPTGPVLLRVVLSAAGPS